MPRLPADIRISLKRQGGKTGRIGASRKKCGSTITSPKSSPCAFAPSRLGEINPAEQDLAKVRRPFDLRRDCLTVLFSSSLFTAREEVANLPYPACDVEFPA